MTKRNKLKRKRARQLNTEIIQDSWNLHANFAYWFVPRLQCLIDDDMFSHPKETTLEEWDILLKEMLEGMKIIRRSPYRLDDEERVKADRALDLFKTYFFHLNN